MNPSFSDENSPEITSSAAAGNRRKSKLRSIALGITFGTVLAAMGSLIVLAIARRETLPPITLADVDAAIARWNAAGPTDYDLNLEQTGINPGVVHIEVRHGNVTAMTKDGHPTRQHLWDEWSVPGLLGVIRRDVEVCMPDLNKKFQQQAPDNQNPELNAPQVFPRGAFDAKYGYPTHYHRITPTGADANWRMLEFQPK